MSLKAVKAASAIINHFIKQKHIMIGVDADASTQPCFLSSKMCRLLSATWKTTDGTIKHLSERVGQSYPVNKALEMLREAESLGFGTVSETSTPTKRKVTVFRKRRYEDLSEDCHEHLKRAKLTLSVYSKSFTDHTGIGEDIGRTLPVTVASNGQEG